jgi:flavorubredoxin
MKKKIYVYFVSEGEYSNYSVNYIAIHTKKFTEKQMTAIIEEIKKEYIKTGESTEDYKVNTSKVEEIAKAILEKHGFVLGFPSGEFHLDSYSKLDDLRAFVPWRAQGEPSGLRIGLG